MKIRTGQVYDALAVLQREHELHTITTNFAGGPPQGNSDIAVDADFGFELSGTNAVSLTAAIHDAGGGIKLLTAGASADQAMIFPHQDTEQSAFNAGVLTTAGKGAAFCATVTMGSAITAQRVHAGLVLTAALDETTDNDQVKFSYDTGSSDSTFKVNISVGGTDTEYDTGVTVEADRTYQLAIVLDSDRKAHCFVDGVEKVVTAALTTAITLKPIVGIHALAAAAKHMYVRRVSIARAH
jgi:hypothetical protein